MNIHLQESKAINLSPAETRFILFLIYVKKIRNYLSKVHKIDGAHLQCVCNHYAKFEYKGMKTVGVTDYTNQTPSKHFRHKKI